MPKSRSHRAEQDLGLVASRRARTTVPSPRPAPGEATGLPARLPARRLGGDFLELSLLERRQCLAWGTLLRIAKGPAEGTDPGLDRAEKLALPFRKIDPGAFRLPPRPPERIQRRTARRFPGIGRTGLQISPIAAR